MSLSNPLLPKATPRALCLFAGCALFFSAACRRDRCGAGDDGMSPVVNMGSVKVILRDSATGMVLYGRGLRYPPDSVHQLGYGNSVFEPHTALSQDTAGDDGFVLSYMTRVGRQCDGEIAIQPGVADSLSIRLGSTDVDTLLVRNTTGRTTEFLYNGRLVHTAEAVDGMPSNTITVLKD
jgi:hypothetical protein